MHFVIKTTVYGLVISALKHFGYPEMQSIKHMGEELFRKSIQTEETFVLKCYIYYFKFKKHLN